MGSYLGIADAVTALATPGHKYPEFRCRAAPAANHPGPSRCKIQSPRLPAENSSCWPAARSSGRQHALETEPDHHDHWKQSRCAFRPVTTVEKMVAVEITPSTFGFLDRRASICRANLPLWRRCSARLATSGVSITFRNWAVWIPGACSDRAGGLFSYQNPRTPASCRLATSQDRTRSLPLASVAEGFHHQPKSDRASSYCRVLCPK